MKICPKDHQLDYKELYELAQKDLRNVKQQLEHWEVKKNLLRQLADELEIFSREVEIRVGLLQSKQ